jgi:hypothetical protein
MKARTLAGFYNVAEMYSKGAGPYWYLAVANEGSEFDNSLRRRALLPHTFATFVKSPCGLITERTKAITAAPYSRNRTNFRSFRLV